MYRNSSFYHWNVNSFLVYFISFCFNSYMYGGRAPKGELCNKVCMCVSMCVCMYVCLLPQCKIVTSFSGSGAASELFMGEKTRKNGERTPSIRRRNSRVSYKTWRGKNARNTPNTLLDGCHLLLKEYLPEKSRFES